MNTTLFAARAVLLAAACAWVTPACGQAAGSPPTRLAPQNTIPYEEPDARVRDLKVQLDAAKQKAAIVKSSYEAGQVTTVAYQDARTEVARLEIALEEAEKAAHWQQQIARLLLPVDVELKNASLAQAAQSLTKAVNLPVHISPSVPKDAAITLSSRGAQLRTVLELLARNMSLRIDPSTDGGVELQPWPQVEVNGQKLVLADPTPWSSAWGDNVVLGGRQLMIGSSAIDVTANAGNPSASGQLANTPANRSQNLTAAGTRKSMGNQLATNAATLNSGQFMYSPAGLLQGVNIAAVGNAVIVAEPGRGPHGEPGAWLTVYLLDGATLVRKSATFHPTRALLVSPAGQQPARSGQSTAPAIGQSLVPAAEARNRK